MATYNDIQVQQLPAQYAGDITIGKIADVSTACTVLVYFGGLRIPEQYSATSTVDGTLVITIPTTNRLISGNYRFLVILDSSKEQKPWAVTYGGVEVTVDEIHMRVFQNCVDVDQAITFIPSTAPISCF